MSEILTYQTYLNHQLTDRHLNAAAVIDQLFGPYKAEKWVTDNQLNHFAVTKYAEMLPFAKRLKLSWPEMLYYHIQPARRDNINQNDLKLISRVIKYQVNHHLTNYQMAFKLDFANHTYVQKLNLHSPLTKTNRTVLLNFLALH